MPGGSGVAVTPSAAAVSRVVGSSRHACHRRAGWHVAGDDCPGPDECTAADPNAAEDDGSAPDRGTSLDDGSQQRPVVGRLERPVVVDGSRIRVVDEHDPVPDEHLVLDLDSLADEGVALDLAPRADRGASLDLYERPDSRVVPDAAAVEVDERLDDDAGTEFDVDDLPAGSLVGR